MTSSHRHLQRQCVLQALFAKDQHLEGVYSNFLERTLEEYASEVPNVEFAEHLYKRSVLFQDQAYELITEFAPAWPVGKLSPIDRVILVLGLTELCTDSEVPKLVVINEAVELAKEFGDDNSSKFINGVLSNVAEKKLNLELKNKNDQPKVSTK